MNRLEIFQLCGIIRPEFNEQRDAEDKITDIGCQHGDYSTIRGRSIRFTSLLQQTLRRRDLGWAELEGRTA